MTRRNEAAKGKTADCDFREGRLAFYNEIAISDNPYKNDMGRAEAWESGRRAAEKSFFKTNQDKQSVTEIEAGLRWLVGLVVVIGLVIVVGIVVFGDSFEASESLMNATSKAQDKIGGALYQTFGEIGRLDVREDCSVRVYISKRGYMQVPYPDRDEAVRTVGKAWCTNEPVERWRLPKVVLRDIETGEELGSYGCLTGWVSKK
jgi:hypothetical protein